MYFGHRGEHRGVKKVTLALRRKQGLTRRLFLSAGVGANVVSDSPAVGMKPHLTETEGLCDRLASGPWRFFYGVGQFYFFPEPVSIFNWLNNFIVCKYTAYFILLPKNIYIYTWY